MKKGTGDGGSGGTGVADGESGPTVSVTDLEKVYGGEDGVRAVDGVSFELEEGTAVGLLGPNGAGKTTVIKTMLSLVVPTAGQVTVNGINVHRNPEAAYEHVGAMLEGARNVYWRLTVRENVEIFSIIGGREYAADPGAIDDLLEQFSLAEKADTQVRALSRGEKQKVSIACTMARDPDVIFLDEPTLGLDVESSLELQRELDRLVAHDDTTVLVTSHDMEVIQNVCDRVIILNEGEVVVDDTVENLLELFNTQTYEITVGTRLDGDLRSDLKARFDAKDFERRTDATVFEATVVGDEFYELVGRLERAGMSVRSIDSVAPDLEDVFLHITEKASDGERAAARVDGGQHE